MRRFFLFTFCILAIAFAKCEKSYAFNLADLYSSSDINEYDIPVLPNYLDDNYGSGDGSGNSFDSDFGIMLTSLVNSYSSTIPEPYLSYMQSFALSRAPFMHYVSYVSRETFGSNYVTVYNIAIGDITFSSGRFSGDVTLYKIYSSASYTNQYQVSSDSSFVLNPSGTLVFSDISGSGYPDFTSKFLPSYYIFYALVLFFIFWSLTTFFRFRHSR